MTIRRPPTAVNTFPLSAGPLERELRMPGLHPSSPEITEMLLHNHTISTANKSDHCRYQELIHVRILQAVPSVSFKQPVSLRTRALPKPTRHLVFKSPCHHHRCHRHLRLPLLFSSDASCKMLLILDLSDNFLVV